MKSFVSGWRRPASKAGVATAEPAARPATEIKEPRPKEIREPRPAPVEKAPRQEVIDAPRPARPRQPLTLPRVGIPGNLGQWGMLAVWAVLFKVSVDATHAAAVGTMFPGADWWTSVYAQAAISLIERFHFAGNRNLLTWGAFIADMLMVGAGLAIDLIPRFFQTQVWAMISQYTGMGYDGLSGWSMLAAALAIGAFIAYSGDKALDLAMGR